MTTLLPSSNYMRVDYKRMQLGIFQAHRCLIHTQKPHSVCGLLHASKHWRNTTEKMLANLFHSPINYVWNRWYILFRNNGNSLETASFNHLPKCLATIHWREGKKEIAIGGERTRDNGLSVTGEKSIERRKRFSSLGQWMCHRVKPHRLDGRPQFHAHKKIL